jgi:hypothetical protein
MAETDNEAGTLGAVVSAASAVVKMPSEELAVLLEPSVETTLK